MSRQAPYGQYQPPAKKPRGPRPYRNPVRIAKSGCLVPCAKSPIGVGAKVDSWRYSRDRIGKRIIPLQDVVWNSDNEPPLLVRAFPKDDPNVTFTKCLTADELGSITMQGLLMQENNSHKFVKKRKLHADRVAQLVRTNLTHGEAVIKLWLHKKGGETICLVFYRFWLNGNRITAVDRRHDLIISIPIQSSKEDTPHLTQQEIDSLRKLCKKPGRDKR